jgi:hypothetical protein
MEWKTMTRGKALVGTDLHVLRVFVLKVAAEALKDAFSGLAT